MVISLHLPLTEAAVRALRVGDAVTLSGRLVTGRDAVHRHLAHGAAAPLDLQGSVIYHCGPVMVPEGKGWRVTAAGPTTSGREEPYMAAVIERLGLRGILGKGGMGPATLDACRHFGCVYLHAVGGAAQVLARHITAVHGVHWQAEFGAPEALWELEVKDFPAIVTMDTHGGSLHADVLAAAAARLQALCPSPSP
ncbi:MAG: FumA C-terminus/TtdB family hydratase beta subunit [Lentisphaeria bacterium]